jgi:hypothetical protein
MSSLFEKCPACNGKTSGHLFCSSPCRSSYLSPSHLQNPDDNRGETARRNSSTFPFEIKRPRAPLRIKTCEAIYTAQTGLLSPSELKQYEDYFDQDRTLKRRNLSTTSTQDYQVTVLPADEWATYPWNHLGEAIYCILYHVKILVRFYEQHTTLQQAMVISTL